ncbi:YdbC family protein [Emergencia sp.]|uniref:YdbC family protein n=1 Tax=Emergencia sp. TaxID=1926557 RepID=UPI003AF16523
MADKKLEFEITRHIAVIKEGKWDLELNKVAWNGNPEKYDLRTWNKDHTTPGKGVTMTREEAARLYEALEEII